MGKKTTKNVKVAKGAGEPRGRAATKGAATKNAAKKPQKKPGKVLELSYSLAELPSSQHRAGLAGLVFMVDWLKRTPLKERGLCEITAIDRRGLTLRVDEEGLTQLLNEVYGASEEEQQVNKPWPNKSPLREEEVTVEHGGKSKAKTFYIYPVVVPRGAYLTEWDRAADEAGHGPWVKLWRDMVWSILRGVPATRKPFEARSEEAPIKEAVEAWKALQKGGTSVPLPSTYFLGAQAATAENVSFKDRARYQFLLHFWPFVAQIYVPVTVTVDNKGTKSHGHDGYAIAIPDVANLEGFCDELPEALLSRFSDDESKLVGYRPKGCLIDLSAEAALDLFARLKGRLAGREGARDTADLVVGVDIFHVRKDGNNVRILGAVRVDPEEQMIDAYRRFRGHYWSSAFRRQRLKNLITGAPWYTDFAPIFATCPWRQTIGDKHFKHDARVAFEEAKNMSEIESETNNNHERAKGPPTLETILYQMVGTYITRKVKSKYDLDYEAAKKTGDLENYNKSREKIAREAFLAIRSRTGGDFVDYFTSTICSIPQHITRESYDLLGRALLDPAEGEKIRTLTMLALSARG